MQTTNPRVTARTVRNPDGSTHTEYRVGNVAVHNRAAVEAVLEDQ